jgi:hypothetical protein
MPVPSETKNTERLGMGGGLEEACMIGNGS